MRELVEIINLKILNEEKKISVWVIIEDKRILLEVIIIDNGGGERISEKKENNINTNKLL